LDLGKKQCRSPKRTTALIFGLVLVGVFTAGFLIGYLPSHSIVRQVQEQTKRLEQRDAILEQSLRITELRGAAGLMRYRVNQNVVPILYGLVSLQTQTLVHIYDRFVWLAL